MHTKTASNQSKNYSQMMNHPRAHEFARIVEWSIQAEGLKDGSPVKTAETTQVNLAIAV